jgi:hypothetical protein
MDIVLRSLPSQTFGEDTFWYKKVCLRFEGAAALALGYKTTAGEPA